MPPPLSLLLIEDNSGDARLLKEMLREQIGDNFSMKHVTRLSDGIAAAGDGVNVVLLDMELPDGNGLEGLTLFGEAAPNLPVVILTGVDSESHGLAAVKRGAQDYLIKGRVTPEILVRSLRYAIERKRAEEAQVESAALRTELAKEKQMRDAKEQFIEMVSHTFRTPLTTINTSAGLIELKGDDAALRTRHLNKILNATTMMVELLDNIVLISLAQNGQMELVPAEINLASFIRDLVEEFKIARGIDHVVKLIINGGCEQCHVDSALISQIMGNLLSNAAKYAQAGTTITIELHCYDDHADFKVTDQGIGISPEAHDKLFNLLYRGSDTLYVYGMGIGLNIAQYAAALHQGTISFESEVGVGTTFTVTLPFLPPDD